MSDEIKTKQSDGLLPMNDKNGKAHASNGTTIKSRHNGDFSGKGRTKQPGLELNFQHVNLNIKGKQILQDVSGLAKPGEILAVMGPSGKLFFEFWATFLFTFAVSYKDFKV